MWWIVCSVPLGCAFVYAWAYWDLKGAMQRGTSTAAANGLSNYVMAATSLVLLGMWWLWPGQPTWAGIAAAIAAGVCLFAGRVATLRSLAAADLSTVGPILSLKTLFVALLTWVTGTGEMSGQLLTAAVLATVGVILMQTGPRATVQQRWGAIALAMLASVLFAGTDVLVQGYARLTGLALFQPIMFSMLAVLTPLVVRRIVVPQEARVLAWRGSLLIGLQTTAMILAIGWSGQATLINILYCSRSLWTVGVDVWRNPEAVRAYWRGRLAGAILLTTAIVLVLLPRTG